MEAEFERAYIVSDLHLGGEAGNQMFSSGDSFKNLCTRITENTSASKKTLLLINGDFVDFLAESGATYWNGERADNDLRNISNRSQIKPVFEGLASFVSTPGAHLVIVLGNHDLEFVLPEVKSLFIHLLTHEDEAAKSRIEFAFDGWGYRFRVGTARALATHGNEVDPFNFTRFDILRQIISERFIFGESATANQWKPSAGTAFVIDAINGLKSTFPFVDLLKPEPVTFLALTILSPRNLGAADEFARLVIAATRNERARPSSERRFLAADIEASPITQFGEHSPIDLEALADQYMRDPNLDIDDLIFGSEDKLLGITDWVTGARKAISELANQGIELATIAGARIGNQLTNTARVAHATALRKALQPFLNSESFAVTSPGKADKDVLAMVKQDYDVVFTGHTHTRRFCRIDSNVGHLVNTGTWAGLMRFEARDLSSPEVFAPIYDLLSNGSRASIEQSPWFHNECPVAVLTRVSDKKTELKLARMTDSSGKIVDKDRFGEKHRTDITK